MSEDDRSTSNRPTYETWKLFKLHAHRAAQVDFLTRAKQNGWDPYPIPLVIDAIDRELERRRVNPKVYDQECEFGPYEVIADVEDLSA